MSSSPFVVEKLLKINTGNVVQKCRVKCLCVREGGSWCVKGAFRRKNIKMMKNKSKNAVEVCVC